MLMRRNASFARPSEFSGVYRAALPTAGRCANRTRPRICIEWALQDLNL